MLFGCRNGGWWYCMNIPVGALRRQRRDISFCLYTCVGCHQLHSRSRLWSWQLHGSSATGPQVMNYTFVCGHIRNSTKKFEVTLGARWYEHRAPWEINESSPFDYWRLLTVTYVVTARIYQGIMNLCLFKLDCVQWCWVMDKRKQSRSLPMSIYQTNPQDFINWCIGKTRLYTW